MNRRTARELREAAAQQKEAQRMDEYNAEAAEQAAAKQAQIEDLRLKVAQAGLAEREAWTAHQEAVRSYQAAYQELVRAQRGA